MVPSEHQLTVFAQVDQQSTYFWDVNSHTTLIISHLASTSSSKAKSGLRLISSSLTGRVEFTPLHVHITPLGLNWVSFSFAAARAMATVLKNPAKLVSSLIDDDDIGPGGGSAAPTSGRSASESSESMPTASSPPSFPSSSESCSLSSSSSSSSSLRSCLILSGDLLARRSRVGSAQF